jgi:glycosyltransferase involved in cell wall biosynthesis
MSLTIVNVAYPLTPVGPGAAGGAEQVLACLDNALVDAGHASIVLACAGSSTRGLLHPLPYRLNGPLSEEVLREADQAVSNALHEILRRWRVDLVHMHGIDFYRCLPEPGVPVLATLHLPPTWYPAEVFFPRRPATFLNCVSRSQQLACPAGASFLEPIENGVPIERLQARHAKRPFALLLGRICPEKGYHLAIDAAARAGANLLLGGELFRYDSHERYFFREIAPRLDRRRRFIGPVSFKRKRRLLTAARCLLVPSLAPETSSLVAMEALACGTPVIAFRRGALSEIIEHGKTGFLVDTVDEMADAITAADQIQPEACRGEARARFSAKRMVSKYLQLYERLAAVSKTMEQTSHQRPGYEHYSWNANRKTASTHS